MAIAFDNAGGENAGTSLSGHNVSFTTGSGDDRFMLVGISANNGKNVSVTSLTYAGVNLTLHAEYTDGNLEKWDIYKLVAPAIGTHNLTISATAPGADVIVIRIVTYSGVDQTAPIDAVAENFTTTPVSAFTAEVTSTVDNAWGVVFFDSQRNVSSGTTGTLRAGDNYGVGDRNAATTPAGTISMDFNLSGSTAATHWVAIAIAPAEQAAAANPAIFFGANF